MNLKYAILSGLLASFGSVFGKLSSEWDRDYEGASKLLVAGSFQILMVLCNIIGLTVFTKSLAEIDSTVVATVTNTACNFIFSGFLGYVLFQELITFEWLVGTAFTVVGFFLITSSHNMLAITGIAVGTGIYECRTSK